MRRSSSSKWILKCSAENDQNIFSVGKLILDRYLQSHGFSEYIWDRSIYPVNLTVQTKDLCTIPGLLCAIVAILVGYKGDETKNAAWSKLSPRGKQHEDK